MARQDLTLSSLAPAAVSTGLFPLFSKVGGEGVGLAAVQGNQLEYLLQAVYLRLLSLEDSLVQLRGQFLCAGRLLQTLVAVSDTGDFHLQQLLFPEPVQGPYDSLACRVQGGDCLSEIETEPGSAFD
jgi:hypothetical protein